MQRVESLKPRHKPLHLLVAFGQGLYHRIRKTNDIEIQILCRIEKHCTEIQETE